MDLAGAERNAWTEPEGSHPINLRVHIRDLDKEGNDRERGTIRWDGRRFWLSENTRLLRSILDEPIFARGKTLTATNDPEAFLNGLCLQYKSPYLRVTEVEQAIDAGEDRIEAAGVAESDW